MSDIPVLVLDMISDCFEDPMQGMPSCFGGGLSQYLSLLFMLLMMSRNLRQNVNTAIFSAKLRLAELPKLTHLMTFNWSKMVFKHLQTKDGAGFKHFTLVFGCSGHHWFLDYQTPKLSCKAGTLCHRRPLVTLETAFEDAVRLQVLQTQGLW